MAKSRVLDISIQPNEIVLGKRLLEVRASTRLDLDTARSVITLRSVPMTVSLSRDEESAIVSPEEDLPPGPNLLVVGELVSVRGTRVSDRIEVPFFVSDSRAKIDPMLLIESIVRLKVERLGTSRVSAARRPDGRFIEIMKTVHRKSGKPFELAFDETGTAVDANSVIQEVQENRRNEFGKLHPTLKSALRGRAKGERVPVAIWLNLADEDLPRKKTSGRTIKRPRAETALMKRIGEATAGIAGMLADLGVSDSRADPEAPIVYAELTVEDIRSLQEHEGVAALFFHDTRGVEDLSNSLKIAQSDVVQSSLGLTGAGVNVAVYEDGPDNTTNLSIAATFINNPATSQHSRHTHGIIKNVEPNKPHGHAPRCSLHSANSMDLDAITWAARTRGCTVISQSFHRDAEQTDPGLSFDDMYKDWLVLHWPYPTILQAVGNGTATEYANHKGFNCLAIGSHDDTASTMAGDSVFRNPASPHSDRESPELAANGTSVTAVGLTLSGTSMAAPAAAGCTALIQEANQTLKSWPEGCRAILLAGASKTVSGGTWWSDRSAGVDASDGSGAVDALESVRIAKSRRSRGALPARRGWDVGTLLSSDIGANGETTFSYQVVVPDFYFEPKVKVALAWDSLATVLDLFFIQFATDALQLDLDLKVYDSRGALVGYSGSWDNSYEIAEFAARRGETYTIKIRRWSGTADAWYGIAWTVQGSVFIRPDWGLTARSVGAARRAELA